MDVIDPWPPEVPPGQDELPYSDGEPMESHRHVLAMDILMETLEAAWHDRDDFFVGGNMFVYFSDLQTRGEVKYRGPDVFVVLDTDRAKVRKSWVAWQEGGKLPDVVIELLSPSTEHVDRGEKMRLYARIWRTGHYVLFDPIDGRLEGYRLERGEYVAIAPDAQGDLPIAGTALALGKREAAFRGEAGPWLRWIGAGGVAIPTGAERGDAAEARADAEQARADAEQARADALAARVAELEAKLQRR